MLDSNIPNVPQTEQLIKILTTQNKIKKICIENEEQLGKGTKAAYQVIRHALSPILRDDEQELHFHIEKAKDLMITHIILHHVENAVGKLYT